MFSQRCGSASRPAKSAGRAGSRPSASTIVSANFAGCAVSRQMVGSASSRCSSATFTPSAVCGSMVRPWRSATMRIVRNRSWWLLRPDTKPLPRTLSKYGVPAR